MVSMVMHLTENTFLMTCCEVHEVTGCQKQKNCDRIRGRERLICDKGLWKTLKISLYTKKPINASM